MWGLAYSGIKNRLLSCSADGTVKLWNPVEKNPCISTFNANKGEHGGTPPPAGHRGNGGMLNLLCVRVLVCRTRRPDIGGLQRL